MKMTNDELQDLKARCLTAIHRDYTIAHVESHIANLKVEAGNPALPADPRMALVALIDTALAIRAGKIAPPAKPIVAPEVKPAPKPEPVKEPEPEPVVEEPKAEEAPVEEPKAEEAPAPVLTSGETTAADDAPAAEETPKHKRGGKRS